MRKTWILSVAFFGLSLFLSGCVDLSYDYTSSFEEIGKNSVTGSEQDSSLANRTLEGQFDLFSKLVPVKLDVIAIDENFDGKDTLAAKITLDGGVYRFSVNKFSYPTSLIKIRYTCEIKDSLQNLKVDFLQYANIANNGTPTITLASAIKGHRIESLIEEDVFSFETADLKATRELYHIFRLDSVTMNLKSSDSSVHKAMEWYVDAMSYCYLGGGFDSTFQKRFENLSLALDDERSWWNSVSKVQIADAIVRNFKERVIPMDSTVEVFANFWNDAYGLPACDTSVYLDEIKNPAESSAYFDSRFVCNRGGIEKVFYYWHPMNKMEEQIGLCSVHYTCSKEYNDPLYVSPKSDMDWRLGTARETVVYLYGECDREKWNQVRTASDTMFLCDRDYKDSSYWTRYFDTLKVSREAIVEDLALQKYGKCTEENNLVKGDLFLTDFVQCVNGKWGGISEEFYYGDSCTEEYSGKLLRTPNANYYVCRNLWDKYAWAEILATEYYGDICNAANDKEILEYDGVYIKCNYDSEWNSGEWTVLDAEEILPPIIHKDSCVEKKVVKYDELYYICKEKEWVLLSKEEAIPPVVDGLPCSWREEKTYVNYGEDYYICTNDKWSFVKNENVPLPEIHGDSCDSRYWGRMVKYDGVYFICAPNDKYSSSDLGYWSEAPKTSVVLYEHNKDLGNSCASGQVGTTLEWNPEAGSLLGCVKNLKTDAYEWGFVRLNTPASISEKSFAGGEFKADGAYEITLDGIAYEFDGFKLSRKAEDWGDNLVAYMYNHHVVIGGNRYEAEWVDTNLYINSMRGETVVALSDIEPKSDSYSGFYKTWYDWVDRSNTCNGKAYGFHFPITSIQLKQYGEGVFADWNAAKSFCPQGFHIPDTTEWRRSSINTRTNAIASIEESYEPSHGLCGSKYTKSFVLLWSSTEKDSETQYCLGYTTTQPYGDNRKDLLECPKDLFPLGQVMCVKDK